MARHRWLPWVLGLVVAAVVLGPALGPGHLLNLDLVSVPTLRLPDWRWGHGPGVPHRVPSYFVLAPLSSVIGGAATIKLAYASALVALFVGVWRLCRSGSALVDAGVALLVAWSPFTVTRVAVGHLGVLWAMAVVAWTMRALLSARWEPNRLTLAAGAAALGGLVSGSWFLLLALVALLGRRAPVGARRRAWLGVGVPQLLWLVPAACFAWRAPRLVGAAGFRPGIDVLAPLELLAGIGFWRVPSQIAPPPWWPLVAIVLAAAVVLGWRTTRDELGRRWALLALGTGVLPIAAVAPLTGSLVRWLSDTPIGAPLRESQRWWGCTLVVLAPALAAGFRQLSVQRSSTIATVAPAAAALLLAGNGLWGAGGVLKPVDYPPGWANVRSIVERAPGTTLVLPWHQYLDVPFAGGRRVLHPLADYLPGDLVASTDPELNRAQEEIDPRGRPAVAALDDPGSLAANLSALGITYVVVADLGGNDDDRGRLEEAPELTEVYADPDIAAFRVETATATASASAERDLAPLLCAAADLAALAVLSFAAVRWRRSHIRHPIEHVP